MENCGRTGKSTLQTVMPQISTDPPKLLAGGLSKPFASARPLNCCKIALAQVCAFLSPIWRTKGAKLRNRLVSTITATTFRVVQEKIHEPRPAWRRDL